jgi:carboxylesterase
VAYADSDIALPNAGPEPYFTEGDNASALLIHGFTGTPYETRPVAQVLGDLGVACSAPCLPGHGQDTAAPINDTTAEAWIEAMQRAFMRLPSEKPRLLVGISMGALLAVELAHRHPKAVSGLILVAPAFMPRMSGRAVVAASWVGLGQVLPLIPKPDRGGDVGNAEARSKNPTAGEVPVRGLREFDRLRGMALLHLAAIRCPVFIAHGRQDNTIDPEASITAARALEKAAHVELHLIPKARHVLTLETGRGALLTWMRQFVERLLVPQ